MNIKTLIKEGHIARAIDLLPDSRDKSALSGRWASLESDNRLGTVSRDYYAMERNRIVYAVLSLVNESENTNTIYTSPATMSNSTSSIESYLQSVIAEYKRRDPNTANTAKNLLDKYRNYQDDKVASPSYDSSGRRLKMIEANIQSFKETLEEKQLDGLEEIVERINSYLEETVPTYNDLAEAYKLAQGRGMDDKWIGIALTNRVDDQEVRIEIAERIENFLTTL